MIPFPARRTARRGSFLLLLSSSSYVIFRFLFFTFFSKPVKKNPYTTKALLFYVLVSHANPKNSTGLSLSVEFFPSIPFLKRFLPLLWHLKTSFSLTFPGISPQVFHGLWRFSDNFYRDLRPGSHERRSPIGALLQPLSHGTPLLCQGFALTAPLFMV